MSAGGGKRASYRSGLGEVETTRRRSQLAGVRHVDMRKLPAAAQEERRRQVIGLRRAGMTYDAIAAQAGLTRTGVFDICKRHAARGAAGLKSGPRGPEPGTGRFLDAGQEAEARKLVRRHTP